MLAWILGLTVFAVLGAIQAWKYAPIYVSHITLVTRSEMAHSCGFVVAGLCVFLSHLVIYWLMKTIFSSPVLQSRAFYDWSLVLMATSFGIVFVALLLWHERRWTSAEGQRRLKKIVEEAARELGIDSDDRNEE